MQLRTLLSLLMLASVCFLSVSAASGQYVTTTATSQVYNQPFDMPGTYISGDTRECSITYSTGVRLSKGDSITGSVWASAPIYLAIVTSGYTSANGRGGCMALLGSQLYSNSGASFQFEWTATNPAIYYVALLNSSPNTIQGYLTINQVTSTVIQQQYTEAYTPPAYTEPSTAVSMSTTAQSAVNLPLVLLAILVVVAVALVGWFFYSGHREAKTVQKERVAASKSFCIECGKELTQGSKFCMECGTKQP
jgi:hypothetical protein